MGKLSKHFSVCFEHQQLKQTILWFHSPLKSHPVLTWRGTAQPLIPVSSRGVCPKSRLMETATIITSTGAAAIQRLVRANHGGGSSCPVCTGCWKSRSPICHHIRRGLITWKSSLGIRWRTTATIIRGEHLFLFHSNIGAGA